MPRQQLDQYSLLPAVQPDQKAELLTMMRTMPKPTPEQVQADKQAAADGTYKSTAVAQQGGAGTHAVGVSCADFLSMSFPPKEHLLGPVLQERDLAMLFAQRGTGKTLFTIQMAITLAGGGTFLKWSALHPSNVLVVDGEMPGALMQARVKNARMWARGAELNLVDKNLVIVTPDTQPSGIKNLAYKDGQAWLMPWIEWASVVILDSLLTLAPYGKGNEAESFQPMQDFLLQLRQMGKTALVVHHAGKSGEQLGTINKETVLDTVFKLSPIDADKKTADTQFTLSFTKNRNFWGDDAASLIVSLQDGIWSYEDEIKSRIDQIRELAAKGKTQKEMAAIIGCDQGTISRDMNKYGIQRDSKNKI